MTSTYTQAIAKAIKDVLINLAVEDKLPLDMNGLDQSLFYKAIDDNRVYGGVSDVDVIDAAKSRGHDLNGEQIIEILNGFEDAIMFDGSGMHGAELIDYVLDEQGYKEKRKRNK
jgi:hypothetical protein